MAIATESQKPGTQPAKASIKTTMDRALYVSADDQKWVDAPPHLPPGTKMLILDGDPAIPDRLFTMRLKMPAGTRLPPHFHPADEHVTVISGEFLSGEGDTFSPEATKSMRAGSFYAFPAGHRHFAFVPTESVIQMHGVGPWQVIYVNPADDPSARH